MNNLIKQIVESKFNFNIDIEGNDNNSLFKSKYNSKTLKLVYNDTLFVDLDLPSGTLWSKYNLGVNPFELDIKENWYGDYYAWGELKGNKTNENGKIYFNWDNYKYGKEYDKLTKYCNDHWRGLNDFADNLIQLLPEDDAAYQNIKLYDYKFHIPTKELCEELISTNNYWVYNYDPNKVIHNLEDDGGIKGLNGRIFEGKNKNQLFIPAAGYYDSRINNVGSYSSLWSSNLNFYRASSAYNLHFDSDSIIMYDSIRCYGCSIHPVINL